MKWNLILFVTLIILLSVCGYFVSVLNSKPLGIAQSKQEVSNGNSELCIPTFSDGGGPYYKPNSPFREKIVPDVNNGEKLFVAGRVLKNDCETPVSGAILDVWQANESGSYEDMWYRGQVKTGMDGSYEIETIIPKGYGEGTGYRPPHIHFKVFVGSQEIITSQMFFPEIKGTSGFDDAFIMKVESTMENNKQVHHGFHDIILP